MADYFYTRTKLITGEYDIDTSYGPNRLINEIYLTLPTLSNVKTISDGIVLKIVTEVILSTEDETILNNTVATHKINNTNAIVPTPFKITQDYKVPESHNINLFGLFRKDTINIRGELVIKEYYKVYDGTTYSDLVVKDDYVYTTDVTNDLVQYRDETITWYLTDNSVGYIKTIKKYYDLINAIKEGVKRRKNLLDKAKAYGLASIAGTHASGVPNSYYWFSTMSSSVETYLSGTIKTDIIDFINNETASYVTQTVKDNMTGILDYWT